MGVILFVAFIVVPLIEITVIGQVQQLLGWPLTLSVLILDSLVGAYVVRRQGALAWRRFTTATSEGRMPTEEIVDGAMILFAGALMLTPGFVTDIVGFLLVLPPTRKILNRRLRDRITVGVGPFGRMFTIGSMDGRAGRRTPGQDQDSAGPRGFTAGPRGVDKGVDPGMDPGVIDVEVVDIKRSKGHDDA